MWQNLRVPFMPLGPGARLGPYEIQFAIGAGGMGEVYRARDARLQRDVAVKVLPSSFANDPERLARLEQEARAAAALNHSNILAVYDVGTHDGAPYIVSELSDGARLRERIRSLTVRKSAFAGEDDSAVAIHRAGIGRAESDDVAGITAEQKRAGAHHCGRPTSTSYF